MKLYEQYCHIYLKFRYSEKATKFETIFHLKFDPTRTQQGHRKVGAGGAIAPPQYLADQLTLALLGPLQGEHIILTQYY